MEMSRSICKHFLKKGSLWTDLEVLQIMVQYIKLFIS